MKKLILFLVCAIMCIAPFASLATSVYMTPNEWASIKESEAWPGFIEEHFLPNLALNDLELITFAQELNISNGFREQWGERYMFGKLVTANSARETYQKFVDNIDAIEFEIKRLLLGPWIGPGLTEYREIRPEVATYKVLINGEWVNMKSEGMTIILVMHTTDKYGGNRRARLAIVDTGIVGSVCSDLVQYQVYLVRKPST